MPEIREIGLSKNAVAFTHPPLWNICGTFQDSTACVKMAIQCVQCYMHHMVNWQKGIQLNSAQQVPSDAMKHRRGCALQKRVSAFVCFSVEICLSTLLAAIDLSSSKCPLLLVFKTKHTGWVVGSMKPWSASVAQSSCRGWTFIPQGYRNILKIKDDRDWLWTLWWMILPSEKKFFHYKKW